MNISDYIVLGIAVVWIIITMVRKSPYVILIPKFWYEGITIGWLVIIKKEAYNDRILVHEYIHFLQQREMLVVFAYLVYWVELICKSVYYRSFVKGYLNVSFEREARMFQNIPEFPFKRKPYLWRYFLVMADIIKVTKDSTEEYFNQIYDLQKANIFKFEGDYSTILELITSRVPTGKTFKVMLLQPGTSLYTQYGYNTFVVTKNETA